MLHMFVKFHQYKPLEQVATRALTKSPGRCILNKVVSTHSKGTVKHTKSGEAVPVITNIPTTLLEFQWSRILYTMHNL